jgi:hypothetical protein
MKTGANGIEARKRRGALYECGDSDEPGSRTDKNQGSGSSWITGGAYKTLSKLGKFLYIQNFCCFEAYIVCRKL